MNHGKVMVPVMMEIIMQGVILMEETVVETMSTTNIAILVNVKKGVLLQVLKSVTNTRRGLKM